MLAQTDAQAEAFGAILWMAALVMIFGVATAIALYIRKRMRPSSEGTDEGFTLADLHRLRNRGELTIAEYETLRDKLLQAKMGRTDGGS
jgi:hypothetical protein